MPPNRNVLAFFLGCALSACSREEPGSSPTAGTRPVQAVQGAPIVEPSPEARAALRKGRESYQAEEPLLALDELRRAVELAPRWADAHLSLGKLLFTLSSVHFGTPTHDRARLEEAAAELARACELDPTNPEGFFWGGCALAAGQRSEEARASLERAIELAPDNGQAHKQLGLLHAGEGNVAEARASLERARELLPLDDEVLFQYGLQLEAEGDADGALAIFQEAVRLNPAHPGPRARLIALYQQRGDLAAVERAAAEYARSKEFGRRLHAALKKCEEPGGVASDEVLAVAELYREAGMNEVALGWFERVLRLDPQRPEAREAVEQLTPRGPGTEVGPR